MMDGMIMDKVELRMSTCNCNIFHTMPKIIKLHPISRKNRHKSKLFVKNVNDRSNSH